MPATEEGTMLRRRREPDLEPATDADPDHPGDRRQSSIGVGAVISATLVVAVAVLIAQNGQSTRIEFLWLDLDAPQWLLLAGTFAVGACTALISRVLVRRWRTRQARAR
jgi:uncharacterized integral membrane protein